VSVSTISHEYGHQIEFSNPEAAQLSLDFLNKRTKGENPVSFNEKFQFSAYGPDEKGSPDAFAKAIAAVYGWDESDVSSSRIAHYTGKVYGSKEENSKQSGWRNKQPTEVMSIGMELLQHDPVAFAKADPEWFDLVTGICTGRLLTETRNKRRRSK